MEKAAREAGLGVWGADNSTVVASAMMMPMMRLEGLWGKIACLNTCAGGGETLDLTGSILDLALAMASLGNRAARKLIVT